MFVNVLTTRCRIDKNQKCSLVEKNYMASVRVVTLLAVGNCKDGTKNIVSPWIKINYGGKMQTHKYVGMNRWQHLVKTVTKFKINYLKFG